MILFATTKSITSSWWLIFFIFLFTSFRIHALQFRIWFICHNLISFCLFVDMFSLISVFVDKLVQKQNTQTHITRRCQNNLNLFKSITIHSMASKSCVLLILVVYSINLTRLMIICNVQVKMHVIITVTVLISVILVKTIVVRSYLPSLGESNKHWLDQVSYTSVKRIQYSNYESVICATPFDNTN